MKQSTLWTLLLALVTSLPSSTAAKPELYTGPWDLKTLRKPPKVTLVKREGNVIQLYYEGEPYQGKPTRVFAHLALPEKTTKAPAMVLVHGGGGTAFREWAELWRKRGYVALAMDLAGQGPDRQRLKEGAGPPQSGDAKFQATKVKDFWSYHAIASVIRGVSLLANRPEVDPERIGVTGISWGGYLTSIVAGLDDRLKVAVPVYGCGFLHENSVWLPTFEKMSKEQRQLWVKNYEPSRYLRQTKMPVLFVNGTNDFAYPLNSYQKSYRLVKNRTLCIRVNMRHSHPAGWAPKEIGLFVDEQLRKGKPFPSITSTKCAGQRVTVSVDSPEPLQSASIHFTTDTGAWQKRKWQSVKAEIKGTTITAKLPEKRPLVWFVTVTDKRGALVSTEHEALTK